MSYCRMVALACWVAGLGCLHLIVVRDLDAVFWLVPAAYFVLMCVALHFADEIDRSLQ